MDITLQTKVSDLLDNYPELEGRLLDLSPLFAKLRNPMLRRTVARVTTLQQAAGVAGISPARLIQELRQTAGLSVLTVGEQDADSYEALEAPDWFDERKIRASFDACPIIEAGQSPMQDIIKLASQLSEGEILEVITPFKPVPIIDILKAKGFAVWIQGNKNFFIKE